MDFFLENIGYAFRNLYMQFSYKKIHVNDLGRHFRRDKINETIEECFYWPSVKQDVAQLISQRHICTLAKLPKKRIGLYIPLSILQ